MRSLVELHLVQLVRFGRDSAMAHSEALVAGAARTLAHLVGSHHRHRLVVGHCRLRHHEHVLLHLCGLEAIVL